VNQAAALTEALRGQSEHARELTVVKVGGARRDHHTPETPRFSPERLCREGDRRVRRTTRRERARGCVVRRRALVLVDVGV